MTGLAPSKSTVLMIAKLVRGRENEGRVGSLRNGDWQERLVGWTVHVATTLAHTWVFVVMGQRPQSKGGHPKTVSCQLRLMWPTADGTASQSLEIPGVKGRHTVGGQTRR